MKFPEKYTIDSLKEHMLKIHPSIEILSNNYVDNDTKITVRCKIHDNTWETTAHRLSQQKFACRKCYDEYRTKIILDAKEKEFKTFTDAYYKPLYDTSKIKYTGNKTKVLLICPEHGEFYLTPNKMKTRFDGCPYCKESVLERKTRLFLINNKIKFEPQKTYDWLKSKSNMFLDFYLPDYNIAIECQGEQHIINRESIMNKHESFENKIERDFLKNKQCSKHKINILYIFSKTHSLQRLDEKFNHIYDNALFIEDIENNNSILLNEIKRGS